VIAEDLEKMVGELSGLDRAVLARLKEVLYN
jgi:hypothetical protein